MFLQNIPVPAEYSDYINIFVVENATKLLKYTKINNYAIKLEKSKQLSPKFIYNLELVELKTLKIYIKINLTIGFIQLFKSPAKISIFLNQNSNKNL